LKEFSLDIHPTRGKGLLEPLLARMRARKANQLIPAQLREGRILDVGCGSFPYFLSHTYFKEKYAIDQFPVGLEGVDIQWRVLDLNRAPEIPFDGDYFDVVTMLAVVEHLNPDSLVILLKDAYRVLKTEGVLIMTTPASWSDRLLHWMARVNLVSKEEIDEHVFPYTLPLLGWYLGASGFEMTKLKFGYFEMLLNMWATARK
jgi:SAM-dependent methyltransferase